ncbi:glycosyltransferase family 4 protein [Gammaproteobacteria bacterium]|nr:glycosyltransferase family 4 protein [Gammaproteobacteria bacterium]
MKNRESNLNILLVGPYPPPFGGISSLFVNLLPGLKKLGANEVHVLHFTDMERKKELDGSIIHKFNLKTQFLRLLLPWNLVDVFKLFMIYKDYNISLGKLYKSILKSILVKKISEKHSSNIISFYQSDNALELIGCRHILDQSVGISLQIFGEIFEEENDFIRNNPELFKDVVNLPDIVTAPSHHCSQAFKTINIPREVEVIYSGVDFSRFTNLDSKRLELRNSYGYKDKEVVFLFLGRFDKHMGLDKFIDAIPKVIESEIPTKFILAGASGPLDKLALGFQWGNKENVQIMTNVPFDDVPGLYAVADVICAPSLGQRACMGLSIKEAMACKKAVIGTNSGGIPEAIIDGETGIIVNHLEDGKIDVNGLAEAMMKLSADSELRMKMGELGFERGKELFTDQQTVDKTYDVFQRCVYKRLAKS